jgi:1,4-dihydroxy-2-naphthoyl-CoA hydrolase
MNTTTIPSPCADRSGSVRGHHSARTGPRNSSPRPDLRKLPRELWAAAMSENLRTGLSGFLDFETTSFEPGKIEARLPLRDQLMMAAGDFLHAGTVVAFADSCAAWGCLATLPAHASGFTTSELKVNLVATARVPDTLRCVAELLHSGRTTQVWDATMTRESDARAIGHFRCTQYLLRDQR